ncbi:MAG: ESX secretion-associated protein EspG [Mycobacteriaceae bacterium]|nr:ESX secretion-associated protein EspG [Mycobacteriaceae bacterium]
MITHAGAVDLTVDAVLLLGRMVGIDEFPSVLWLEPNVFFPDDQDRVDAVVLRQLTEAGIVGDDGRTHPRIALWLRSLDRPDMEIAVDVYDLDRHRELTDMLRLTLVRCDDTHVLATRCGDQIVLQELVGIGDDPATALADTISAAMGAAEPAAFAPFTIAEITMAAVTIDDAREAHRELRRHGAGTAQADTLARSRCELRRWAAVTMIEHHDGGSVTAPGGIAVYDAPVGRIATAPSLGPDGTVYDTYTPGAPADIARACRALLQLLPAGSWTETSRRDM